MLFVCLFFTRSCEEGNPLGFCLLWLACSDYAYLEEKGPKNKSPLVSALVVYDSLPGYFQVQFST